MHGHQRDPKSRQELSERRLPAKLLVHEGFLRGVLACCAGAPLAAACQEIDGFEVKEGFGWPAFQIVWCPSQAPSHPKVLSVFSFECLGHSSCDFGRNSGALFMV